MPRWPLSAAVGSCCLCLATSCGPSFFECVCDRRENDLISMRGDCGESRISLRPNSSFFHHSKGQALRESTQPPKPPPSPRARSPPPFPPPTPPSPSPHLSAARDVDGDAAADVARAEARAAGADTTKAEVDATRHMATKHTIWAKLNIVMAPVAPVSFAAAIISCGVGSSPVASGVATRGGGGDGGGEIRAGVARFFSTQSHAHKHEDEVAEICTYAKEHVSSGDMIFRPLFFLSTMVDFQICSL